MKAIFNVFTTAIIYSEKHRLLIFRRFDRVNGNLGILESWKDSGYLIRPTCTRPIHADKIT